MVQRITNYNVPIDCCTERTCDQKATNFVEIEYMGLDLFIVLCDEHADEFKRYRDSNQKETPE